VLPHDLIERAAQRMRHEVVVAFARNKPTRPGAKVHDQRLARRVRSVIGAHHEMLFIAPPT
jgi:hypothetical protein